METYDNPADISTIRKMFIDPSKFKNSIGKGMHKYFSNIHNYILNKIYFVHILDIPIYYNFNTNEINGDGIYILHPETRPFSVSVLNPLQLRLEEEQFVQLANPNSEVY